MSDGFNNKGLCKLCKEPRTKKGHDPCIANLPGVLYACCGHGLENGYIKFEDGRCMKFAPIEIELDKPKNFWVHRPVPMRTAGDRYPVLKFKTGKKKSRISGNTPIEYDGWKLIKGER